MVCKKIYAYLRMLIIAGLLSAPLACKRDQLSAPTRVKSKGNSSGVPEATNSPSESTVNPRLTIEEKNKAIEGAGQQPEGVEQPVKKPSESIFEVVEAPEEETIDVEGTNGELNTEETEAVASSPEMSATPLPKLQFVWKTKDKVWTDYIPFIGKEETVVLDKVILRDQGSQELVVANEEDIVLNSADQSIFIGEIRIGKLVRDSVNYDGEFESTYEFYEKPQIENGKIKFFKISYGKKISNLDESDKLIFHFGQLELGSHQLMDTVVHYRIRVKVFNQKHVEEPPVFREPLTNLSLGLSSFDDSYLIDKSDELSGLKINQALEPLGYKEYPLFGLAISLERQRDFGGYDILKTYYLYLGSGENQLLNLPLETEMLHEIDGVDESSNSKFLFTVNLKSED